MKFTFLAGLVSVGLLAGQNQFTAGPALDAAIEQAVQDDQIPGAVLMVGNNGKIVYQIGRAHV